MLKVKTNLDNRSYYTLINDIKLFKITKNDGSINKNKFMNLLFKNFYKEYLFEMERVKEKALKIMNKYNLKDEILLNELSNELYDYKVDSQNENYIKSLTFYLTMENEFIYESIRDKFYAVSDSNFFRKIIYRYLEYPEYKREEIIYKNIVDSINEAIKSNEIIKLKLENSEIIMKPYKIESSKEEIYSYLIGFEEETPKAIHILKIRMAISLKEKFTFKKEEIILLDDIINHGVQFTYNKRLDAIVEFNKAGIKQYEARYLHRPDAIRIEGNKYYFSCSSDQLYNYLLPFGDMMKVISPSYLGMQIYNTYKKYTTTYEKEHENEINNGDKDKLI